MIPTPLGSEDREQPAVAMTVRRSTGRIFYIKKQNRLQIKTNNANLSFFCLIVKLFLAKYESFFFCRSGIFLRENISCSALSEASPCCFFQLLLISELFINIDDFKLVLKY